MSSSGLHHLCRGAVGELRAFGVSQRLARRGPTLWLQRTVRCAARR
jgi:hypothetical protein